MTQSLGCNLQITMEIKGKMSVTIGEMVGGQNFSTGHKGCQTFPNILRVRCYTNGMTIFTMILWSNNKVLYMDQKLVEWGINLAPIMNTVQLMVKKLSMIKHLCGYVDYQLK